MGDDNNDNGGDADVSDACLNEVVDDAEDDEDDNDDEEGVV
jgi:hypothetical protein